MKDAKRGINTAVPYFHSGYDKGKIYFLNLQKIFTVMTDQILQSRDNDVSLLWFTLLNMVGDSGMMQFCTIPGGMLPPVSTYSFKIICFEDERKPPAILLHVNGKWTD